MQVTAWVFFSRHLFEQWWHTHRSTCNNNIIWLLTNSCIGMNFVQFLESFDILKGALRISIDRDDQIGATIN